MSDRLRGGDGSPHEISMDRLCEDIALVLNAPLHFSSKHAFLAHAAWKWSERDGKYLGCRWWSQRALDLRGTFSRKRKLIVHEHVIPKRVVIEKLFAIEQPQVPEVRDVLARYCHGAVITRLEDRLLTATGLRSRMPDDWDDTNVWARYDLAGIVIVDTAPKCASRHCHSYNE